MTLTAIRLLALFILFVITFLVGTVPIYIFQLWSKRQSSRRVIISSKRHKTILSSNFYIQILTQIGGGILFFTVFVHMIPEIRNNFEAYLESNDTIFPNGEEDDNKVNSITDLSIPYLELAICGGFFAIYFIEELMHTLLVRHDHSEDSLKDSVFELDVIDNNNIDIDCESVIKCQHNEPILIGIKCHNCE